MCSSNSLLPNSLRFVCTISTCLPTGGGCCLQIAKVRRWSSTSLTCACSSRKRLPNLRSRGRDGRGSRWPPPPPKTNPRPCPKSLPQPCSTEEGGDGTERVLTQSCGRPLRRGRAVGTLGRRTPGPEGVQIRHITKVAAAGCMHLPWESQPGHLLPRVAAASNPRCTSARPPTPSS
ncbi:hypothetical protein VPH35_100904 [Triticum aestivum]